MRLTIYFLIILPLIMFVSKPSYSVEDKDREIILLKNQIDNLKWELKKKNSNTNQDVDKSQSNSNREEIQNLTQKYEKEIIFLKNQISILTKEKNTSDNKILKLTNELEGNDSESDYKSKFEELSLQFENLNDELENIIIINEQLDNEITSLKNEVVKKNIAEKEDKKIVQQKNEDKKNEVNKNNEKENTETVSNGIVKEVSFETGTNYENCGVAKAKYIFYSDYKYELFWFCPENNEPDIYTGTWENISKNSDLFNHISTIYIFDKVEYEDIIKIYDNSIDISWNGQEAIKYRFSVERKLNEIPNDLTDNALECFGQNNMYEEMLAIHFTSKNQVKYSYIRFGLDSSEKYIMILNKDASFNYEVNDKYIEIKTEPMFVYPYGPEDKGITRINRKDLVVGPIWKERNSSFDNFPYPSRPQCILVDINNLSSQSIFEEIKKYTIEEKTEKKNKL